MNVSRLVVGIIVLASALAGGVALERYVLNPPKPTETAMEHAARHLEPGYVCPMHSQIISDQPGSCPICGMKLVEKAIQPDSATDDSDFPVVRISPDVRHNFGIKLDTVEKRTLFRKVTAPGFVRSIKSGKRYKLRAPVTGKVQRVYIADKQLVKQGDKLLTMVSQLAEDAQAEHLALYNAQKQGAAQIDDEATSETEAATSLQSDDQTESPPDDSQSLLENSRQRLRQIGLSNAQIRELEQSGSILTEFDLLAPDTGTLIPLGKVEAGMVVDAGQELYAEQAYARITVVADAVQRDIAWIENGYPAELTIPHAPSKTWPGIVSQKASRMTSSARTIGVRFAFNVPQFLVQNSMYVKATVVGDRHDNILSVPRDALIRYENETHVVRMLEDGGFQPVAIKTGIESGDYVQVLEGLQEGDKVVVSGQFLLDSESNLRAGFRRMAE